MPSFSCTASAPTTSIPTNVARLHRATTSTTPLATTCPPTTSSSNTTTTSSISSITAPRATSSREPPKNKTPTLQNSSWTGSSAVAWAWARSWWRCVHPSSIPAPGHRPISQPAGPASSRRSAPLTRPSTDRTPGTPRTVSRKMGFHRITRGTGRNGGRRGSRGMRKGWISSKRSARSCIICWRSSEAGCRGRERRSLRALKRSMHGKVTRRTWRCVSGGPGFNDVSCPPAGRGRSLSKPSGARRMSLICLEFLTWALLFTFVYTWSWSRTTGERMPIEKRTAKITHDIGTQ